LVAEGRRAVRKKRNSPLSVCVVVALGNTAVEGRGELLTSTTRLRVVAVPESRAERKMEIESRYRSRREGLGGGKRKTDQKLSDRDSRSRVERSAWKVGDRNKIMKDDINKALWTAGSRRSYF
jgi:hypothetical protein